MATFSRKWKLSPDSLAALLARYAAGEPRALIASSLGVSIETVYYHARKEKLTSRPEPIAARTCGICGTTFTPPRFRGKKYCSVKCQYVGAGKSIGIIQTKEGSTVLTNGYRVIHVPKGHVSRSTTRRKRNSRVMEHVLIGETALGRPLKKGEVVHHINCDKLDNRRSNLLICSYAYHAWLHGEMSRRYAQEKFA